MNKSNKTNKDTREALFHVSYCISFLKIEKNTLSQKPQLLEILRTWTTALNAPLNELPARKLIWEKLNLIQNKRELGRNIKKLQKEDLGGKKQIEAH